MKSTTALASLLLSAAFTIPAAAANYTVTVEPNYPPARAQEVYQPLLTYLDKATGQHFVLKTSANYHVFWRDLRAKVPTDFAFEEAHFTDYRINRQHFTPLVRLADPTKFTLLVDNSRVAEGVNGLIGSRIVSMSAPSLGYLLLIELYKNPIAQPQIQSVAATWQDGVEMVFSGETDAAMVPSYIASTYPNLAPLSESREFTGRAFSAAPTVPANVRKAVADALLKMHKDNASYQVLSDIGATQFVPATAAEYAGNERLLRGVFGYQAIPGVPAAAPAPTPAPAAATTKPAAAKKTGG